MISELFIQVVSKLNNDFGQTNKSQIDSSEYFRLKLKKIKDGLIYAPCFQPKSQHYPILFLPTEPTHLSQIKPILNNLKQLSIDFLIITNRLPLHRLLKFEFKSIFIPGRITEQHQVYTREIRCQTELVISNYRAKTDLLPLDYLGELIYSEISNKVNLYFKFDSLIKKYTPNSVFVGNDTTVEGRMMTFLSKKFSGIKSFCIMHGSVTGEPLDTYHQVDCFFLYGQAAMDDLARNGMPADRLKISGAPYLDDLV